MTALQLFYNSDMAPSAEKVAQNPEKLQAYSGPKNRKNPIVTIDLTMAQMLQNHENNLNQRKSRPQETFGEDQKAHWFTRSEKNVSQVLCQNSTNGVQHVNNFECTLSPLPNSQKTNNRFQGHGENQKLGHDDIDMYLEYLSDNKIQRISKEMQNFKNQVQNSEGQNVQNGQRGHPDSQGITGGVTEEQHVKNEVLLFELDELHEPINEDSPMFGIGGTAELSEISFLPGESQFLKPKKQKKSRKKKLNSDSRRNSSQKQGFQTQKFNHFQEKQLQMKDIDEIDHFIKYQNNEELDPEQLIEKISTGKWPQRKTDQKSELIQEVSGPTQKTPSRKQKKQKENQGLGSKKTEQRDGEWQFPSINFKNLGAKQFDLQPSIYTTHEVQKKRQGIIELSYYNNHCDKVLNLMRMFANAQKTIRNYEKLMMHSASSQNKQQKSYLEDYIPHEPAKRVSYDEPQELLHSMAFQYIGEICANSRDIVGRTKQSCHEKMKVKETLQKGLDPKKQTEQVLDATKEDEHEESQSSQVLKNKGTKVPETLVKKEEISTPERRSVTKQVTVRQEGKTIVKPSTRSVSGKVQTQKEPGPKRQQKSMKKGIKSPKRVKTTFIQVRRSPRGTD